MEVNPLASHPPMLPSRTNSHARRPVKRDYSTRSQKSNKAGGKAGGLRETRTKRSPSRPLGKETDKKSKSKVRLSPIAGAKPLLPAAERRSGGEDGKIAKGRKEVDSEKWDITPDGGSAGREGRQFTVSNVGNNGKIYLR